MGSRIIFSVSVSASATPFLLFSRRYDEKDWISHGPRNAVERRCRATFQMPTPTLIHHTLPPLTVRDEQLYRVIHQVSDLG